MNRDPREHLILTLMAKAGMNIGEGIPIDAIVAYGTMAGFRSGEIEAALARSRAKEWIVAVERNIHLTRKGYLILRPANDNPVK